jgi:hypothetical protein
MATRESLQCRLWLLGFGIVQLAILWQCGGAWLAHEAGGHGG